MAAFSGRYTHVSASLSTHELVIILRCTVAHKEASCFACEHHSLFVPCQLIRVVHTKIRGNYACG